MNDVAAAETVLEAADLRVVYRERSGFFASRMPGVVAVDGVSIQLGRREVVGIVGESGCGKTTLGRTLAGLQRLQSGRVIVDGVTIQDSRDVRHSGIQYLHQDASGALDPWWTVGSLLGEAVSLNTAESSIAESTERIGSILSEVRLVEDVRSRYPHELSGGQIRRVALARLLLASPRILILDEPTAGLDISVQASVLQLIRDVHESREVGMIVVSHDFSVIRALCSRIYIMYLGKVVETGPTAAILDAPRHHYTRLLLDSVPRIRTGRLDAADDSARDAADIQRPVTAGCSFAPRCAQAQQQCRHATPALAEFGHGHSAACYFPAATAGDGAVVQALPASPIRA